MRITILLLIAVLIIGCSRAPVMTTVHGKSVEQWISVLQGKDAQKRRKAAEVLGNVGVADPQVIPALTTALKDRDPNVRSEAILSLLKIGPAAQEAVAALDEARNDRDAGVRANAVKALERIRATQN
jgi:HEAT repeat protein